MNKFISNISPTNLNLSDSSESDKDFLQKKRKQTDKKISITKYTTSKYNSEKRRKKNTNIYIDLSLKKEKFPIKILKSENSRLLKNFNYITNYITSSNILHYRKTITPTTVNNPLFNSIDSLDEFQLPKTYHCTCKNICIPDVCECIEKHSQKFECNDNCTCYKGACGNRNLQYGLNHSFSVKYISRNKGFGVFAEEDIEAGEFVCEYIGTVITKNEAEKKIHINHMKQNSNYVLQLKEEYPNVVISTYIDSELYGNFARFINHSCEPNLDFEIIRVNSFIPHCAFFANKNIKAGEEITFNYTGTNYEIKKEDFNEINKNEEEKENNKIENEIKNEKMSFSYKKCFCGSKNCKGFIPN